MTTVCAICEDTLTIEIEVVSEDEEMTTTEIVPDDVLLACGEHFHWQCLLDSTYELSKCPTCGNDISSSSEQNTRPQIFVSLNNEGGLQHNIDLFPMLQEECYLKTYPEERKPRAFLEFCREGDYRAAVGVLQDDGDEDEDAGASKFDAHAILRYQDPLAGEQSALHAAAANGHREVAWLLLLLASEFPELDIPALVYQEASSLQIMREDQNAKVDIRKLRDVQGRTAEDVAREGNDVIWNGWFGNGRLSLPS